MFTCLQVYMFTCLHVHMFTCLHVYMFTCLQHVYMFTCLQQVYMFTCLQHVYMFVCASLAWQTLVCSKLLLVSRLGRSTSWHRCTVRLVKACSIGALLAIISQLKHLDGWCGKFCTAVPVKFAFHRTHIYNKLGPS